MEVCPAEDNARLERLVSADAFDEELALRIARRACWEIWGWKEYWDVLRTVWQLNRTVPEGRRKMRLVGINYDWDGPSFALVRGLAGDGPPGPPPPVWERLRVFRVAPDFVAILAIDEIYARNIEREIIEKGEKGVVWVGVSHAPVRFRYAAVVDSKIVRELPRMGFMLHQKYGNRVCHIMLHEPLHGPRIARVIEESVSNAGGTEVGFDVTGSPWAALRDGNDPCYRGRPGVCFGDIADGYIFLKPMKALHRCAWLPGYISPQMFVRNKPFYELFARKGLKDSAAANEAMAGGAGGP
jgi:hypothetical protein